jgi:hypothetical protein
VRGAENQRAAMRRFHIFDGWTTIYCVPSVIALNGAEGIPSIISLR